MTKLAQLLIIGMATGSIYGLIALGFTLVYKATKVFNFRRPDDARRSSLSCSP
jgi:branched-chain amino acid transport system permease protein